jgi:hypothetical protein
MVLYRVKIVLVVLGCLTLAALGAAGADNEKVPPPEDKQVVSSKATARTVATSVNFKKELGLSYPSLGTLGSRIDTARRTPDPVALAHAANELAVAEKVSGKTASLTSAQLIKESAELASLRRQEQELNAVNKVAMQVQAEEKSVALLKESIALAQTQTKAEQDAFKRNEEPTSAPRQVVVNNYTTQYLDIWVNGYYKTQVLPGSTQVITIEHRWNPTVLTAYGNDDATNWGPRYIWGQFTKYTWNLN